MRGVLLAVNASAHFTLNIFDDAHASALEAMSLVQPGAWAFCESIGTASCRRGAPMAPVALPAVVGALHAEQAK